MMALRTWLVFLLMGAAHAAPRQKGIALGLFAEDPGWSYRSLLKEIAQTGATDVELVIPWYQSDVEATQLFLHPRFSPTDEALVRTIREAHALGLKVLLFPIVRLTSTHRANEWRGTLRPADPAAWMRNYTAHLVSLARLAAQENVAALSIGSELSTLDVEEKFWRELIARVRTQFSGQLLYSANWDHLDEVGFAADLDLLGLNAYFELGESEDADLAALVRAWIPVKARVSAWAGSHGKPLYFTEVGFPSVRGGARWPWDYTREGAVDLGVQSRAYQAFLETWWSDPAVAGLTFYELWGDGGADDNGYTPWDKPAASVLGAFYRSSW